MRGAAGRADHAGDGTSPREPKQGGKGARADAWPIPSRCPDSDRLAVLGTGHAAARSVHPRPVPSDCRRPRLSALPSGRCSSGSVRRYAPAPATGCRGSAGPDPPRTRPRCPRLPRRSRHPRPGPPVPASRDGGHLRLRPGPARRRNRDPSPHFTRHLSCGTPADPALLTGPEPRPLQSRRSPAARSHKPLHRPRPRHPRQHGPRPRPPNRTPHRVRPPSPSCCVGSAVSPPRRSNPVCRPLIVAGTHPRHARRPVPSSIQHYLNSGLRVLSWVC
jgi:hypothetical protein